MIRRFLILAFCWAALALSAAAFSACGTSGDLGSQATPTDTPTGPTVPPTAGPTATPIPIPTAIPTSTPPPTPTPTVTPSPTPTATPLPTPTPIPTPTPTVVPNNNVFDFPERPPSALGLMVTANGYVVPVLGGEPGAWVVGTPCLNGTIITSGERITSATVLIDPGHGGSESGAVGPTGLIEADLNLDVALRLQQWLEGRGIGTALTRTQDYYLAIRARNEIAQALQPELMISIHHNGAENLPTSDIPGVTVFFQVDSAGGQRLGGLVQEQLMGMMAEYGDVQWIGGQLGGAHYRLSPSGEDFYGVLRGTRPIVSVLSEAMYLTNPEEEALLYRDEVRQREAEALGGAIVRYLTTDDPGSGVVAGDTLQPWPGSNTGGTDECPEPVLE